MSMENLMKALMQSAEQSQQPQVPQQQAGGGDVLSEVLGGLMGGAQQSAPQQGGGDMLSGLLGGLLGGGQRGNSGDQMLGALEQIIGGRPGQGQTLGVSQGAMNMGANDPVMMMVQPIVNQLAAKAKIPPQIATVVVSIAVHYLLSSHPSTSTKAPMNLGSFMQELSSGNVSPDTLHNTGMVKDVMQATGLDQQKAQSSLSTMFGMLASHLG
jgi:hypothetical protein